MHTLTSALVRVDDRATRWAVIGTIRPGEAETRYALTGPAAEEIRDEWIEAGRYQVTIHPPRTTGDLAALGGARRAAQAVVVDVTQRLQAAVIHAVTVDGRAEAEVARQAGVDRMTVRSWLGK